MKYSAYLELRGLVEVAHGVDVGPGREAPAALPAAVARLVCAVDDILPARRAVVAALPPAAAHRVAERRE